MTSVFNCIFNMSITATYVIIAVLAVRLLLSKAPKAYSYILWSIVGFRLAIPVSFKSVFSIFSLKPFDMSGVYNSSIGTLDYVGNFSSSATITPSVDVGISTVSNAISHSISSGDTLNHQSLIISFREVFSYIWLGVMVLMLLYGIASYIMLRSKMSTGIRRTDNIYESDNVSSPFILGFISPKIYIPFGLDDEAYQYVIAHEKYHLRRCDHIVKMLSYILLCVHWFNPLCWIAFYMLAKDMEMSCDERVLALNDGIKKEYSSTLLSFAVNKKIPSPSPLCFGESAIKGRVKNILRYKKPKMLISFISIILVGAVVAGCASNPDIKQKASGVITDAVSNVIPSENAICENTYMGGKCIAQSPILSSLPTDGNDIYTKVIVDGKRLTIYDKNGEKTIDAEGDLTKLDAVKDGNYYLKINNYLFEKEDIENYFGDTKGITQLVVQAGKQDIDAVVYFKDGKPVAIGNSSRFFELLPYCENLQSEVSKRIKEINYDKYPNNSNKYYYVEAHDTLQISRGDIYGESKESCFTVYTYPYYAVLEKNVLLCDIGSCVVPTALTFSLNDKSYAYQSYWQPREDPAEYKADLEKYFPKYSLYSYNTDDIRLYNDYLYKIKNEAYKEAIEKTNYEFEISEAIDCIAEDYKNLSRSDYNGNYNAQYDALICYGEYTMRYIYTEFLKGNQNGNYGNVMAHLMIKITGDELKAIYTDGQDYFNQYLKYVTNLYNRNKDNKEYMQYITEDEPYIYLLLEIAGVIEE